MTPDELSKEIMGAASAVLKELGPGLDGKLYERALVIELRKRGYKVDQQRPFPVYYSGELIGSLEPDVIVDDQIIADPMVVESFTETHARHMIGYLAVTKFPLALLLNFKRASLEWKPILRETYD